MSLRGSPTGADLLVSLRPASGPGLFRRSVSALLDRRSGALGPGLVACRSICLGLCSCTLAETRFSALVVLGMGPVRSTPDAGIGGLTPFLFQHCVRRLPAGRGCDVGLPGSVPGAVPGLALGTRPGPHLVAYCVAACGGLTRGRALSSVSLVWGPRTACSADCLVGLLRPRPRVRQRSRWCSA